MTTRQTVVKLRTDHPDWTLAKIGQIVDRTRERVRQILISEGLEQRSTKAAYSRQPSHMKKGQPCKKCGTPVPYRERLYKGGGNGGSYPRYCSAECRPKEEEIELICFYCNKPYVLTVPQARSRKRRVTSGKYKANYCSHSCSTKAYWDVVHGKTPNDLNYSLDIGPKGVKREELARRPKALTIVKTTTTEFHRCPKCDYEWKAQGKNPKQCPSCQIKLAIK